MIKDLVGGMLVILENEHAVGDAIEVGKVSGQVERIALRTTHVRTLGGNLYLNPMPSSSA